MSTKTVTTTQRRCAITLKQEQALKLRMEGHSLAAIARKVGYSDRTGAFQAIKSALLKTLQEPAAALRKIELQRLDMMFQKLWPRAMRCDMGAIDRILKIMERHAKLLGLDAPAKTQLTGADGGPVQVAAAKPILIMEANGFEGPGAPIEPRPTLILKQNGFEAPGAPIVKRPASEGHQPG